MTPKPEQLTREVYSTDMASLMEDLIDERDIWLNARESGDISLGILAYQAMDKTLLLLYDRGFGRGSLETDEPGSSAS